MNGEDEVRGAGEVSRLAKYDPVLGHTNQSI
jgi:hypothetical protein